jgi:hypothetical protein
MTGLTLRTFRRMVALPPIVSAAVGMGSNKATLLRLGTPAPDRRKVQNTMSKIWREHLGREMTTHREYGLLCGLAEAWPDGFQVKIFQHTLNRWGDFMGAAKLEIEAARMNRGQDLHLPDALIDPLLDTARLFEGEELFHRFYAFPTLGFLRKFHHIARDVYEIDKGVPIGMVVEAVS